jgi:hypothetical protein
MSDFDNPWKDVLAHFFGPFLAFFFPEAHAAIDWTRKDPGDPRRSEWPAVVETAADQEPL